MVPGKVFQVKYFSWTAPGKVTRARDKWVEGRG
jgi:hypothetical protein